MRWIVGGRTSNCLDLETGYATILAREGAQPVSELLTIDLMAGR